MILFALLNLSIFVNYIRFFVNYIHFFNNTLPIKKDSKRILFFELGNLCERKVNLYVAKHFRATVHWKVYIFLYFTVMLGFRFLF